MKTTNSTKIIAEPGKQEIIISREFDAPRDLVFKAYTDPDLYSRWIGPRKNTIKIDKFEPKNGGRWRYVAQDKDGNAYAFHGIYHEVLVPERMIGTFEFEGLPEKGHVELDTAKFENLPGGRTKLTIQALYQSVEDRDGMLGSGMEGGITEGFERLDELLDRWKDNN